MYDKDEYAAELAAQVKDFAAEWEASKRASDARRMAAAKPGQSVTRTAGIDDEEIKGHLSGYRAACAAKVDEAEGRAVGALMADLAAPMTAEQLRAVDGLRGRSNVSQIEIDAAAEANQGAPASFLAALADIAKAGDLKPPARADYELEAKLARKAADDARSVIDGIDSRGVEFKSTIDTFESAARCTLDNKLSLWGAPTDLTIY